MQEPFAFLETVDDVLEGAYRSDRIGGEGGVGEERTGDDGAAISRGKLPRGYDVVGLRCKSIWRVALGQVYGGVRLCARQWLLFPRWSRLVALLTIGIREWHHRIR